MIELGIILLVLGAIVAIACHFATVPVGVRIGLGVAVLGGVLVLLGYLLPALGGVDTHDDHVDNGSAVMSVVYGM
jgi:hypothetical protein